MIKVRQRNSLLAHTSPRIKRCAVVGGRAMPASEKSANSSTQDGYKPNEVHRCSSSRCALCPKLTTGSSFSTLAKQKKNGHLDIKIKHCSYHGILKNQAWLRLGVRWCAKSRLAAPPRLQIMLILRDSVHLWRCVGTLTSPHGKWVDVDRILLDGWACSLVCLPLAQPTWKEHCQGRLSGWTNRGGGAWSGTKIAVASLLETSFACPGQNQRDNEKGCAKSSTESDEVRTGWTNQHACAQRKHYFVSSGVMWSGYKWRRRDNISTYCTGANVLLEI